MRETTVTEMKINVLLHGVEKYLWRDLLRSFRENYTKNSFLNNAITFLSILNKTIIVLNKNEKIKHYLSTELQ